LCKKKYVGNLMEQTWKQLKKKLSKWKHTEILEDTIHLWGPSGDTVAVLRKIDKTIIVYDFSLTLDKFENRVNKHFYKKIKDLLRKTLPNCQDPNVKIVKICGTRNLETDLNELFSV